MNAKEILALTDEELEKMRIPGLMMPLEPHQIYIEELEKKRENTGRSLDEIIEDIVNTNRIQDEEHVIFDIKAYQHLKGRE